MGKCGSVRPSWLSLPLDPDTQRTQSANFTLFDLSEGDGDTHLEPPGRFLSRPRRFLSAKEGLQ